MRSIVRILLVLYFSVGFGLFLLAQGNNTPAWHVRMTDQGRTKLSAVSNAGKVEFRNGNAIVLAIPAASITDIFHTTDRVRRSSKAYNFFEDRCCGGTSSHLLSALAAAVAAPTGTAKTHYVEVHWTEDAGRMVVLELDKDRYVPFMDWLQQLSGTNWRDLEREREHAIKNVTQRAGAAFRVQIRYPQGEGIVMLSSYSVLPIDDEDNTQLYFFKDSVKAKNLAGILPATRHWSINDCVYDAEVLYGKCNSSVCDIKAIVLPSATYRIGNSAPLAVAAGAPESDTSCNELEKQKAERMQSIPRRSKKSPSAPPSQPD